MQSQNKSRTKTVSIYWELLQLHFPENFKEAAKANVTPDGYMQLCVCA